MSSPFQHHDYYDDYDDDYGGGICYDDDYGGGMHSLHDFWRALPSSPASRLLNSGIFKVELLGVGPDLQYFSSNSHFI